MHIAFIIAAILLLIFLLVKLSGKLIKVIVSVIFVGFVIYILTGAHIINEFLAYIGIA